MGDSWWLITCLRRETPFLDWTDLRDIIRCQWPINPTIYLAYRLIMGLYMLATLIWAFTVKYMKYQWKYFTYMSNWGYTILVISFVVKAAAAVKFHKWLSQPAVIEEETPLLNRQPTWILNRPAVVAPLLVQLSWLLQNISFATAFSITFSYWQGYTIGEGATGMELGVQIHAVNSAVAILDILLSATPTLLLHFYQPCLFNASYVAFSAFYKVAGGTDKNGNSYIYEDLNWDKPELALGWGLKTVVGVAIAHTALWFTSVVRLWLEKRFCTRKSDLMM